MFDNHVKTLESHIQFLRSLATDVRQKSPNDSVRQKDLIGMLARAELVLKDARTCRDTSRDQAQLADKESSSQHGEHTNLASRLKRPSEEPPIASTKKSKKSKIVGTEHPLTAFGAQEAVLTPPTVEFRDISAEVDTRLKEREERKKKRKEAKKAEKRKLELSDSVGAEGATVEKSRKKKLKTSNGNEEQPNAVDGTDNLADPQKSKITTEMQNQSVVEENGESKKNNHSHGKSKRHRSDSSAAEKEHDESGTLSSEHGRKRAKKQKA